MNNFQRMLSSDSKLEDETSDVLAKLLRRVLKDLKVNHNAMNRFLDDWIANPRNGIPKTDKNGTTWKGNMIAQMSDDRITIRTFLRTVMLLGPKKFRLILEAEWGGRLACITRTGVEVDVDDIYRDIERSQANALDEKSERRKRNIRMIEKELAKQREEDSRLMVKDLEEAGQQRLFD